MPMWPFAVLVLVIFAGFFHLMWFLSENTSSATSIDDFPEESLAGVSFEISDESPIAGNYEYIDYPAARYANGTVLYSAMGPEDCPPVIENVEYLRGSSLLISPKQYDDSVECSGELIAVIERISREDGEMIDRDNVQTIVINANIPDRMLWVEPENSIHDHNHSGVIPDTGDEEVVEDEEIVD